MTVLADTHFAGTRSQARHARDTVIGGTLVFTLVANGSASLFAPGWWAASAIVALNWSALVALVVARRDGLVLRLAVLGLVAGFTELAADRWLVDATRTLVYEPGGPFVVRSPLYMPFAWGAVLVQTSYVGWRLLAAVGVARAALVTGLLGAMTIPLYEWWAKGASWWHYRDCRMIGVVPTYIIIGEFLCAALLVVLVRRLDTRPWWAVGVLGVVEGLGIWAGYAVGLAVGG